MFRLTRLQLALLGQFKHIRTKPVTWSMLNQLHKRNPCLFKSFSTKDVMSIENAHLRKYLYHLEGKFEDAERSLLLQTDDVAKDVLKETHTTVTTLGPLVYQLREYHRKEAELKEFDEMIKELSTDGDEETLEIAKLERGVCLEKLQELEDRLLDLLLPDEKADDFDIILEVSAGVGGIEAMLFTADVFSMYEKFAFNNHWDFEVVEYDESDMGGLRKASALISGEGVYRVLKFEGGVHRVQRVPKTEKSGRIHTSTMTVAIMPRPTEIDVVINTSDIRIDTFRASGAGGQHVNTTNSAVRLTHAPTNTVVECQAHRSQIKNRELAMQILRSRIYEREAEEQMTKQKSQRKLQAGSQARSDKIRTYNYQQDRVTDHRIHKSFNNLNSFLNGGEEMEDLISQLMEEAKREQLKELLEDFSLKQSEQL